MTPTYTEGTNCHITNEWCTKARPHQHRTWTCDPTCLCRDHHMAKHLGVTT